MCWITLHTGSPISQLRCPSVNSLAFFISLTGSSQRVGPYLEITKMLKQNKTKEVPRSLYNQYSRVRAIGRCWWTRQTWSSVVLTFNFLLRKQTSNSTANSTWEVEITGCLVNGFDNYKKNYVMIHSCGASFLKTWLELTAACPFLGCSLILQNTGGFPVLWCTQ